MRYIAQPISVLHDHYIFLLGLGAIYRGFSHRKPPIVDVETSLLQSAQRSEVRQVLSGCPIICKGDTIKQLANIRTMDTYVR
jgi:hypothetical protein